MKIIKMVSQHRRDFVADYECEHCGYKEQMGGHCGKTSPEDYEPRKPKYPEHQIV